MNVLLFHTIYYFILKYMYSIKEDDEELRELYKIIKERKDKYEGVNI